MLRTCSVSFLRETLASDQMLNMDENLYGKTLILLENRNRVKDMYNYVERLYKCVAHGCVSSIVKEVTRV